MAAPLVYISQQNSLRHVVATKKKQLAFLTIQTEKKIITQHATKNNWHFLTEI